MRSARHGLSFAICNNYRAWRHLSCAQTKHYSQPVAKPRQRFGTAYKNGSDAAVASAVMSPGPRSSKTLNRIRVMEPRATKTMPAMKSTSLFASESFIALKSAVTM